MSGGTCDGHPACEAASYRATNGWSGCVFPPGPSIEVLFEQHAAIPGYNEIVIDATTWCARTHTATSHTATHTHTHIATYTHSHIHTHTHTATYTHTATSHTATHTQPHRATHTHTQLPRPPSPLRRSPSSLEPPPSLEHSLSSSAAPRTGMRIYRALSRPSSVTTARTRPSYACMGCVQATCHSPPSSWTTSTHLSSHTTATTASLTRTSPPLSEGSHPGGSPRG